VGSIFDLQAYYRAVETEYEKQTASLDYDAWAVFSASRNRALREYLAILPPKSDAYVKCLVGMLLWSEYNGHLAGQPRDYESYRRIAEYKSLLDGEVTVAELYGKWMEGGSED